ncbi:MAG: hypothetical protein HY234_14935 [Acidobacteria bacterium]|nr:hypothetical protein [Acidobacteriota bacterium]
MSKSGRPLAVSDDRKFEVHCDAGAFGSFSVGANGLALRAAQRVRRDGTQEMWESVVIIGKEEENGSLVVQVLICNPEWDEPVEVARIRSQPKTSGGPTIECDLGLARPC